MKLKIFIVDDNEDTLTMLSQLLSDDGFDVHTANTMQSALSQFPLTESLVLLSDLGLPDGSGWELLRRLRQAGWAPYAIAMSGFGALADVAASMDAGFRHHLIKPFDLDALKRLLEGVGRGTERSS